MAKRSKHSAGLKFEVTQKLQDMGIAEPHLFLCEVMAGHDPRGVPGQLFELVKSMSQNEDEFGAPNAEAWEMLKLLVFAEYKVDPITLARSADAAKELLTYMYPKLKNVEVSGDLEHLVKVVPLSKDEIDAFEKRFNDDY